MACSALRDPHPRPPRWPKPVRTRGSESASPHARASWRPGSSLPRTQNARREPYPGRAPCRLLFDSCYLFDGATGAVGAPAEDDPFAPVLVLDSRGAGRGAAGGAELPVELPLGASASCGCCHSGIAFRSSAVFWILNSCFCASQWKESTGSATLCAPTPSTPPSAMTSRSTFLLAGSIRTVETFPMLEPSLATTELPSI